MKELRIRWRSELVAAGTGRGKYFKRRGVCVLAMVATWFALAGNAAFAATLWVNDDLPYGGSYAAPGPGTSCNKPGYPKIQLAVFPRLNSQGFWRPQFWWSRALSCWSSDVNRMSSDMPSRLA